MSGSINAATIPVTNTVTDAPQTAEANTTLDTTNVDSAGDEQLQEMLANYLSTQAFSLLSQSGSMAKSAMSKGNQRYEELLREEDEEERDRQSEFGMPEY